MPGISVITMTAGPDPARNTVRSTPSWVKVEAVNPGRSVMDRPYADPVALGADSQPTRSSQVSGIDTERPWTASTPKPNRTARW